MEMPATTTTELIELLKRHEFANSGKPRRLRISCQFEFDDQTTIRRYLKDPTVSFKSLTSERTSGDNLHLSIEEDV